MNSAHLKLTPKPIVALLGAGTIYVILVSLAYQLHPAPGRVGLATTKLILLTGMVIGWLIGLLASPYSSQEQRRFSKYAATISAFVSGFALAKLESSIAAIFDEGRLISEPLYGARLLLFVASVITGTIAIYVLRQYLGVQQQSASATPDQK